MGATFRNSFYAGLLAAFIIGLWLVRLWGAENQVRLHSEHLIRQVEKRDWSAAGNFVAADYHDDWGDDRTQLLARLRLVLRLFSSLTISVSEPQTQLSPPPAIWRAHLRISGQGGEAVPKIIKRINGLTTPFELRWRRASRWPWDWKLVAASNPSLEISGDYP